MTTAANSVRSLVAATGLSIALAVAGLVAGNQNAAPLLRPAAMQLAASLCRHWTGTGPTLAITGSRLRWLHQAPEETAPLLAAALIKSVEAVDDVFAAVRGRWVVVADLAPGSAVRMDCASGHASVNPLPASVTAVDVSDAGVILALDAANVWMSYPSKDETGPDSLVKIARPARLGALGDVMWTGEMPFVYGSAVAVWIDVTDPARPSYSTETVPLGSTGDARRVFWYNGLIYLMRDRCLDIFVGTTFTHQLREAACVSNFAGVVPAYLVSSKTRLTGLAADGSEIWNTPRPTVAVATFTGKMHEVMDAVANLAAAPWLSNVPAKLDGTAPYPASVETQPSEWRSYFDQKYWSSPAAFEAGMKAITARGWNAGVARLDPNRMVGTGVSARRDRGTAPVVPGGRTLDQIETEHYGSAYTDAQVQAIWSTSGALAQTLEGRLFDDGWVAAPNSVAMPTTTEFRIKGAAGENVVQHVDLKAFTKSGSQSIFDCTPSTRALSATLESALLRGTTVAGGLGSLSDAVRRAGANVHLHAEDLAIVDCETAAGDRTSALVARNARIEAFPAARGSANVRPEIHWPSTMNVAAVAGKEPQWLVRGPLVIGTRAAGQAGAALDPALLRPLMNRVLPGHRSPILVPVTRLQMAVTAPQGWQAAEVPIDHVDVDTAEATPAQTRGVAVECHARAQREALEKAATWFARPREASHVIGLAENAIVRDHATVLVTEKQSIWAVPNKTSPTFDIYDPQRPPEGDANMSKDEKHRLHGASVAALLVSQIDERGLLDRGTVAWINTADTMTNNAQVLDRLVNRKTVVNMSVVLSKENWGAKDGEGLRNVPAWKDGILIVAAAANLDETEHGPLISWRLPNVLGVGVVDEKGDIPENAPYSPGDVDLVAPGVKVPLHMLDGSMQCLDGTSFAAAHVTAAGAMLLESAMNRHPLAIRARLLATADWEDRYQGKVKAGRLNAARAVEHANKSVLTIKPSPTAETQRLFVRVPQVSAGVLEVSAMRHGKPVPAVIDWLRLLRLQRLPSSTDAVKKYRVTYLTDEGKFTILDEVTIADSVVAPFSKCTTLQGSPATCTSMSIHRIIDFVAEVYPHDDIDSFQ